MAMKTALFLAAFLVSCLGAFWVPLAGILGYIGHYHLGPERQWWGESLAHMNIRFSFSLGLATAIGIALNFSKLRFRQFLSGQEMLLLLMLALIWLSAMMSEPASMADEKLDHPAVKITKVILFCMMLTHVVTNLRSFNLVMWTIVLGAFSLGWQTWTAPQSAFTACRIETVGGVDFVEVNGLGAYLAAMLPLIAMRFLQSRWKGKLLCAAAGAFVANGIVLTRSRGAFVGVMVCLALAALMAPRKYRGRIAIGVILGACGMFYLIDPGYMNRAQTISFNKSELDASAANRLEIWSASLKMLSDKPQGVGVGNFIASIGQYDATQKNRDAHNIFVRCWGELGIQGFTVFVLLILNALHILRRLMKQARFLDEPNRSGLTYGCYGLLLCLITLLTCGMTVTLLYTEALWWLLALPVCLQRVYENMLAQNPLSQPLAAESARIVACSSPQPIAARLS